MLTVRDAGPYDVENDGLCEKGQARAEGYGGCVGEGGTSSGRVRLREKKGMRKHLAEHVDESRKERREMWTK
ncbi:MAG: hypothetical protein E7409_02485 [Ruminococcaceae bacterium]|nr:hypothetical protein [Oscillospiraceae bacterium]